MYDVILFYQFQSLTCACMLMVVHSCSCHLENLGIRGPSLKPINVYLSSNAALFEMCSESITKIIKKMLEKYLLITDE